MSRLVGLVALSAAPLAEGVLGKSTYAMSHPFAFKAWMEKYIPSAENVVQENSTTTCNEWVKLCIDDGSTPFKCSGPQGNVQLHSVGAYKRDSGAKTLEAMEGEFTEAMGGMKSYDPFMELHTMFHTTDLDSYIAKFKAAGVAMFASTFDSGSKKYSSIIVQVDGSLQAGAGSQLLLEFVGDASNILASEQLHHHAISRASEASLLRAASSSSDALTLLHISFPSSDVTRDATYFEKVLGGTKSSKSSAKDGSEAYTGTLFSGDTVEIRYASSASKSQGPVSVAQWEAYAFALHSKCIASPNIKQQGFDRLADNHIGAHASRGSGSVLGAGVDQSLDGLIKRQVAAGLPYRVFSQPSGEFPPSPQAPYFLYLYGYNGWGYQITGSCDDPKYCSHTEFYDMCTQGITGSCQTDGNSARTLVV